MIDSEIFWGISNPGYLGGVEIIVDANCSKDGPPVHPHKKTRHQSVFYHKRISKKWLKRFGFKKLPAAYDLLNGSIICHPAIYNEVKMRLQADNYKKSMNLRYGWNAPVNVA